jgi:maltose/moltooligosaccharide transporter
MKARRYREGKMNNKPTLSFWQIWNMCFGFLGIQFGFALQNANTSRIFQTLGASIDDIPALWIAAPFTGLIVQPIVGYFSDRTWTRLGRRRPFFLMGAILASLALLVMPHSSVLWIAAGTLWIMDASFNIAMEPFRALVGDQLPNEQRSTGFVLQSFFIGVGSVVASLLPWLLAKWDVSNTAAPGEIPDTVRYAFYFGAIVLFAAIGWTVLRTKEYPPEQLRGFEGAHKNVVNTLDRQRAARDGVIWLFAGLCAGGVVFGFHLDKQLYLLVFGLAVYGALLLFLSRGEQASMVRTIISDMRAMPNAMRQLAVVQFFSWFAMFAMWIYTTAAVTEVHFGSTDTSSAAYNDGANWVGVLFSAYNGFAALAAIAIAAMVKVVGVRVSHLLNVVAGGVGLISFLFIRDPNWLLLSMVGVGFAWASILSLPYVLLSNSLPAEKMGIYMGIFNFFIVIPQLLAASVLGFMLKLLFGNQPIYALVIGGVSLVIAGLCVLRVKEADGVVTPKLAEQAA